MLRIFCNNTDNIKGIFCTPDYLRFEKLEMWEACPRVGIGVDSLRYYSYFQRSWLTCILSINTSNDAFSAKDEPFRGLDDDEPSLRSQVKAL